MRTLRIIGLCLITSACSPKDPEDTGATSSGSTTDGSTSTPGSSSSSGETPTTGAPEPGSSGSESATGPETGATTTIGDSTTTLDETTLGTSEGSDDTGPALACDVAGTSNLEGVCIVFPPQKDSFTLAEAKAGIAFEYAVIVSDDVPGVINEALVTCAEPGPSGLIVRETVSDGGEQNYCVCDQGLCPEPPPVAVVLAQGTYPSVFPWDGVNWNGPSDTGNPKGEPFPPGMYTVKVTAVGTRDGADYEVTGALEISLTP